MDGGSGDPLQVKEGFRHSWQADGISPPIALARRGHGLREVGSWHSELNLVTNKRSE